MIPRFTAKRIAIVGSLAAVCLVASILVGALAGTRETVSPSAEAFAVRGAEKVKMAYAEWVKEHDVNGGDRNVVISIGYWKSMSAEYTRASGLAKLDLIDGSASVTVSGLPPGQQWDVWLVDNRPGPHQSVKPEPSDAMVKVGRLVSKGDTARLDAKLGPSAFRQFHVDLVVVARADGDPVTTGLLFGAPALFQRLYTARRSETLLALSDFAAHPGIEVNRRWASRLGVPAAEATGVQAATPEAAGVTDHSTGSDRTGIFVNEDVVFNTLVARGANLFLNEKFRGNGRTCATCHRKDANFTIDVNFIAALPDDDALFVAEFNPKLAFTPGGKKFEVPILMRKHGLIVENQDGMDDLVNKFNMRGVPHTLGMRQSLTPASSFPDGTTQPPNQRTGWSGDGAPGNGTLREFATGAVTQHFPKTLNRINLEDFRLPTDAELDAMEAFQLTLGRQVDLDVSLTTGIVFKDPQVKRGQQLFIASPANGGGGCNACHANAGATASFAPGQNFNFNTGVENQLDRPQALTLQALGIDLTPNKPGSIPRDGGFGQQPGEGPDGTGFGNGTFNTPSLVEAADSGPFFHDNSVATIEGAVAFYNSDAFANSPGAVAAGRPNLGATQVEAIAAFLRAINALDNIHEATETAKAAKTVAFSKPRVADELLKQAIAETTDAMSVLFARSLHTGAVKALEHAIRAFTRASDGGRIDRSQIDEGLRKLENARADVVQ
jgi:cytochrome c peroxidase